MVETFSYKNIILLTFSIKGDKSVELKHCHSYNYRDVRNKEGVVVWGNHGVNAEIDVSVTSNPSNCAINTVYVSQKSRIPRDLIRKTYKITLSPAKADAVIIPKPEEEVYLNYNFLVRSQATDNLYICTFWKDYVCNGDDVYKLDYTELTNLKKQIEYAVLSCDNQAGATKDWLWWLHDEYGKKRQVYFIPKIKEYLDILNCVYPGTKYVYDTNFPLQGSNIISIETLDIWSRYSDDAGSRALLEKVILASNWEQYPYTICTFLRYSKRILANYPQSEQFKYLLRTIMYNDGGFNRLNRTVTPDDWNLSQRYMMHILGVSEDSGGFVEQKNLIDVDMFNYVRYKVAVKPLFINKNMALDDLLAAVHHSS